MKLKNRTQQGFTLIELLVVITIIAILASLSVPVFSRIQERGNMTKAINNCRQIILSEQLYAGDNDGNYSDAAGGATTSNDAFNQLFVSGILTDEKIFGCPSSANGMPDGDVGTPPTYANALVAGENHWSMTGGLTNSSSGGTPFVFENATNAAWDPTWDADAAGKTSAGRTWSGGKVVLGKNDGSVNVESCSAAAGQVKLKDQGSGGNLFAQAAGTGGGTAPTVLGIKAKS